MYRPGTVRTVQRGRVPMFFRTLRPIEARLADVRKRRDWPQIRADVRTVRTDTAPISADGYRTDRSGTGADLAEGEGSA